MGRRGAQGPSATPKVSALAQIETLRNFVPPDMGFTESDLTDCLRQCGYNVSTAAEKLMTGEYQRQKGGKKAFFRMTASSPSRNRPKSASHTIHKPNKRKSPSETLKEPPRKSPASVATSPTIDLSLDNDDEDMKAKAMTPTPTVGCPSAVVTTETKAKRLASPILATPQGWLLCQRWISDAICTSRNGSMGYQERLQTHVSGPTFLRLRGRSLEGRLPNHIGRMLNPLLDENLVSIEASSLMQESNLPMGASVPISLSVYMNDPRKFFQVFQKTGQGTESATIMFWEKANESTKAKRKGEISLEQAAFDLLQWAQYGDVPEFQPEMTEDEDSSPADGKLEELDENDFETASADESIDLAKEWSESFTWAEKTARLPECDAPDGFKDVQLRPYQKQALEWMRQREVKDLSRNEMEEQLTLLSEMAQQEETSHVHYQPSSGTPTPSKTTVDVVCDCGPVLVSDKARAQARTCDGETDPVSHPLWQRRFLTNAKRDQVLCFFVNEFLGVASHQPISPPQPCSGGILADAMGLGKTVMLLGLVLRGKQERKRGEPNPTLVVAKLSLLPQWEDEIRSKTNLTFATYYGAQGASDMSVSELEKMDVILTTYGTMQGELKRKNPNLIKTKWLRVILDEAHSCRNERTLASKAVCSLDAIHRWAISGTIMVNGVQDLYGIFKFLRHEPWCLPAFWKAAVSKPMTSFEKTEDSEDTNDTTESLQLVLSRLRRVLGPIMLRRTRDSLTADGQPILTLPPVESKTVHVELEPTEREFYQAVLARSLEIFDGFVDRGTASKSYIQILSMISRLRQCCDHISLTVRRRLEPTEDLDDVKPGKSQSEKPSASPSEQADVLGERFMDSLIAKLSVSPSRSLQKPVDRPASSQQQEKASFLKTVATSLSQSIENQATHTDDECPICLDPTPIAGSLMTPCGHIFCKTCLVNHLKADTTPKNSEKCPDGVCPVCNERISTSRLVALRVSADNPAKVVSDYFTGSTPPTSPFLKHKPQTSSLISNKTNLVQGILQDAVDGRVESSKMKAVLDELEQVWALDPGSKVLIFSQFLGFLDLLEPRLTARGVPFSRLDGQISLSKRVEVLKEFRSSARPKGSSSDSRGTVLLMSMNAGGEGLNLVAASTVFIVDPWWNKAKEDQCINRIVRLGQKAAVCRVRKFIVRQSVEERIVELQSRKQYVADEIYESMDRPQGSTAMGGSARLTLEDLQSLFQS